MKHSINTKLFLWFVFLVIIIIALVGILNSLVLEDYYIFNQKKNLKILYAEINELYTKYPSINNQQEIDTALEAIDSKRNIDILIQNEEGITLYTTSRDFTRNKFIFNEKNGPFDYPTDLPLDEEGYNIKHVNDDKIHSEFILLCGKLDNHYSIFILRIVN